MKIAIFSGSIPSTTFVEHLINGVSKTNEVLLFGVVQKPTKYASKNIKVYNTPKSKIKNKAITVYRTLALLMQRPKDLFKIGQELKRFHSLYSKWNWYSKWLPLVLHKPDILHLQWAKDVEFYMFLKRDFNIKILLSLRGAHINYSPIANIKLAEVYRNQFPKIDGFHAVSKAIGLEAQKYGAASNKIQVIHSPIPKHFFDAFHPLKKEKRNTLQIVSVGRFHWKKGYKDMLDALVLLKEQGIQATYTIIGPKTYPEDILFQIHQLGLVENVKIIASLPQDSLIHVLKTFDIMVLPSLEEGIANVVLEAMAIGIPVVSTNCGGMAEVVIPKETGWLVSVRDPEALANAIMEIKETSEMDLQDITKKAHEFVQEHFNAEESVKQFINLYESICHLE